MTKPKNPDETRGNLTKLDPKAAKIILDAIRGGEYVESAAERAGVHRETVNHWRQVGTRRVWEVEDRRPSLFETACALFSDAYARAEAEGEAEDIGAIRRAGLEPAVESTTTVTYERVPDAKGRMRRVKTKEVTVERRIPPDTLNLRWHAQHRYGPRWAARARLEHSGPENADGTPGPIPVELSIDKVIAALAALRPPDPIEATATPALPPAQEEP